MTSSQTGKIVANLDLPAGRQLTEFNGETVLAYCIVDPKTGQQEWRAITRAMFSQLAGQAGCPPLIRSVGRGGKKNLMFCHLWVDPQTGHIYHRVGELCDGGTFENITWKSYETIPGVKNKGIGSQQNIHEQGLFEGSRKWVEFLEKKKYKLMFPGDEVVGNQLYFYRSTEPEMLTSNFIIPDAMLAHPFEEKRLVGTTVIVQPKFDGKRNMCGKQGNMIISASRGRKQEKSQHPHLQTQLAVVFTVIQERVGDFTLGPDGVSKICNPSSPYWLDGEVYNHGFGFQKLMSATQSSVNSSTLSKQLNYVVYDLIDDGTSKQLLRLQFLQAVFADPRVAALENIQMSPTVMIDDFSQIAALHVQYEQMGYEGAILRQPEGLYVQKRSWSVMKLKSWITEEWYIVGAEEATGTHVGCVVWILNSKRDGSGAICKGSPSGPEIGTLESRRQQFQNQSMFMGVTATIKFFSRHDGGVPRFPSVIAYNRTDM